MFAVHDLRASGRIQWPRLQKTLQRAQPRTAMTETDDELIIRSRSRASR
jgi:hypothetical protein